MGTVNKKMFEAKCAYNHILRQPCLRTAMPCQSLISKCSTLPGPSLRDTFLGKPEQNGDANNSLGSDYATQVKPIPCPNPGNPITTG